MNFEYALKSYFLKDGIFKDYGIAELSNRFVWTVPRDIPFGIKLEAQNSATRNVELRYKLNKIWISEPEHRLEITTWIVKAWGGIRNILPDSLETFVRRAELQSSYVPVDKIASFSKVLSVANPDKFAIFDARVAVSLNAIQLLHGVREGTAFPYLPGRNNITGNWSAKSKKGFSTVPEFSTQQLESAHGWVKLLPDFSYETYIDCLAKVRNEVSQEYSLTWYEMCLFADAESLASKLMKAAR